MKYRAEDFRKAETKTIDITEYLPGATEPVFIKVKRYSERVRAELLATMIKGQSVDRKNELTIHDSEWVVKEREKILLEGVVVDEDFPFNFAWDKKGIEDLGMQCPEFIQMLIEEIRKFNLPLAEQSEEESSG